MGKEARTGLLLGATACLLAVMVDWVVEELKLGVVDPARTGLSSVLARRDWTDENHLTSSFQSPL